jgi:hypothetical protein
MRWVPDNSTDRRWANQWSGCWVPGNQDKPDSHDDWRACNGTPKVVAANAVDLVYAYRSAAINR